MSANAICMAMALLLTSHRQYSSLLGSKSGFSIAARTSFASARPESFICSSCNQQLTVVFVSNWLVWVSSMEHSRLYTEQLTHL